MGRWYRNREESACSTWKRAVLVRGRFGERASREVDVGKGVAMQKKWVQIPLQH